MASSLNPQCPRVPTGTPTKAEANAGIYQWTYAETDAGSWDPPLPSGSPGEHWPCPSCSTGVLYLKQALDNIASGKGLVPTVICPSASNTCTSQGNFPSVGTWRYAISAFAAALTDCSLNFDAGCGIAGMDDGAAWEVLDAGGLPANGMPSSLTALAQRIDCTQCPNTTEPPDVWDPDSPADGSGASTQCTARTSAAFLGEANGAYVMPHTSGKPSTLYCPQARASAYAMLAMHFSHYFVGSTLATPVSEPTIASIEYNYCKSQTTPTFAKGGLWTGGTYSVQINNDDAANSCQIAWTNMLNGLLKVTSATCACCSYADDGDPVSTCSTQTEMCGGKGWCTTKGIVVTQMGTCADVVSNPFNATPGAGQNEATCTCPDHFTGSACSVPQNDQCPMSKAGVECGGDLQGACNSADGYNRCYCSQGWGGADCTIPTCPHTQTKNKDGTLSTKFCSGNGSCLRGVCECNSGFDGVDCSEHVALRPAPTQPSKPVQPGFIGGSALDNGSSGVKSSIHLAAGLAIGILLLIVVGGLIMSHVLSAKAAKQNKATARAGGFYAQLYGQHTQ